VSKSKKQDQLINEKGIRFDGRKLDELRPITMKTQVLSRPDGSAYIEHGRNKIYAAIYGPREIHPRHLSLPDRCRMRVQYRMGTFSVSERKKPAPSRRELEISKVIREAIEPAIFSEVYPRTGIDIYVQVMEADGGTRCASVNAVALALANAGVPMRDIPVACSVGKVDGKLVLDLSDIEDQKGEADVPLAWLPREKKFTLFQMDGRLTQGEVSGLIELFKKGAGTISELQRAALRENYVSVRDEVAKKKVDTDEKGAGEETE